jgi:G:T/U-mismatch repair DNA glycosylase
MPDPKFLKINNEHVGHIWYSHSRAGWLGALFAWGEKATPLGPFRSAAQAGRAIEKAAKDAAIDGVIRG